MRNDLAALPRRLSSAVRARGPFFTFALAVSLLLGACTHPRVRRLHGLLDPLVGSGKKADVAKLLGDPVHCKPESTLERCEYRTSREQNDPVPIVFTKQPGFGPDVSPYQFFDTVHCVYDSLGTLKEWVPVVVQD